MKQLLLLLSILCMASMSFAQRTISGTVMDETGTPVIGATVLITGTSVGTVSDIDGNWSLTTPDENNRTLEISYTGFDTQRVPIGASSVYAITLREGVDLSEVVVTGYSSGSRRDATAAVSTIETEKLAVIPSANVEQQLQGRASGVTVITNGQPGTTSKVRIRGFGSFNANQPLFVVDGVPTQNVDFLSPDDIETTTILKDAPSASIYGSRASNGVIVYTTKKGARNTPMRVSYDLLAGTTDPGAGQPILNPQQQADWTLNAFRNARISLGRNPDTTYSHPQYGTNVTSFTVPDFLLVGNRTGVAASDVDLAAERALYNDNFATGPIYLVIPSNRAGTDWYDEATQWAPIQRHNLGFSGGNDKGRYYFGLNAQDQQGILLEQRFQRYGFRANSEFDVLPFVRVGENIQMTYNSTVGLIGGSGGAGVSGDESDILSAFRLAPAIPVRNSFGGFAGTVAPGFNNPRNVVAQRLNRVNDDNRAINGFGNVYAEIDILKNKLFFRSVLGGSYTNFTGRFFGRRTYEDSENSASVTYNEFAGYNFSWVATNTLNWDFDLGSAHNIKGLVGYEALRGNAGYFSQSSGINPFSQDPNFVSLNTVNNPQVRSNFNNGVTYASILGQVQYNYASKYYLTGVVRQDQSSAFDPALRTGTFPAISGAWRVTGEKWLQPGAVLSDLKVRGGWGIMGNADAVSSTNRFNLFGGNLGASSYDLGGGGTSAQLGFIQTQIGNPNARWEEASTSNIGFEATFFDTKFDFIVDVWQRKNSDVLIRAQLPDVAGGAARPFVNVGAINNSGIDMELVYRDRRGDFNWEAIFTGSWLNNEVERLSDDITFFESGGTRIGAPVRNLAGEAMSSFFGYRVEGLFQNQAEVDAAPDQLDAAPGRFRFADIDGFDDAGNLTGRPDGRIDAADRTVIGNPIPDFTGGVNLRVAYKGFDVETFLYTSIGNEIFNFSKWFTDFYPSFPGAAVSERVLDSWTPQNTGAETPIFENISNFSTNTQINSFYVEDGSYLRMRHITLGYSLPSNLFQGRLTRARVYVSANNIFTITKYQGLDPQVGGAADTDFGVDIGNFPVTRSFNFGIGLGF